MRPADAGSDGREPSKQRSKEYPGCGPWLLRIAFLGGIFAAGIYGALQHSASTQKKTQEQKSFPGDTEERRARLLLEQGKFAEALRAARNAVDEAQEARRPAFSAVSLYARILEAQGDVEGAIEVLEEEARRQQVLIQPEPYGTLARLHKVAGNGERAKQYEVISHRIQGGPDYGSREKQQALEEDIRKLLGEKP